MNQLPPKFDEQLKRVVLPATFFVHTSTYGYHEQILTVSGEMTVDGLPGGPRRFDMTFKPEGESWRVFNCFIWPEGE